MVTISLHRKNKRKPMNIITEARRAFACNILLGTTWFLAFFAVEEVTMLFQWLFCLINSLQGFFIFLFYTARNQDVRNAWSEVLGKNLSCRLFQRKTPKNSSSKDKKGKTKSVLT